MAMKLFKLKHIFTVPSLLNISGIAIAVAAFYVIMSVVDFDLTYNHSIKDYDKVYNLSLSWRDGEFSNIISRPIGEEFGQQMPSVVSYGCLDPWEDWSLYAERNGEYCQMDIRTASISKGLLETFDIHIVEGDTSKFDNLTHIMISRENAKKYNIHIGDFLRYDLNNPEELEVVAIYDVAPNTELRPFGGLRCIGLERLYEVKWSITNYYYKTLTPIDDANIDDVSFNVLKKVYHIDEELEEMLASVKPDDQEKAREEAYSQIASMIKVKFIPLSEYHLAPQLGGFHEPANRKIVYTLLILAIVVILIAYINYVNFFLARVPQRIKSINTMKILGSSRTNLVMMLVGESLIYTFISLALAYVLAHTFAPRLLGGAVDMDIVFSNSKILVISILIPILTAIVVSIYPAMHITSISPALAIRGKVTPTHDNVLRYMLIGFQIVASATLIIMSMFIHKNIDYIAHSDLGFNRKNLLGVETSEKLAQHRDDVRSLLLQNPDIIDVTWARSEFIALNRHNVGMVSPDLPGVEIMFDVIFTDDHFLQFMGIDIVEGRDFMPSDLKSESGAYIFNETARHQYNLTTETRLPRIGGDYSRYSDIVGICKDFKFKPLNYELSPVAFCIPGKDTPYYAVLKQLYVRLADNADVKKSMDHISNSLAQIDPDFAYMNHPVRTFQNEMMSSNYTKEETLTQLITLFAMIAILISVMGIFGIVYFEMERRRKEIGIRKVNGAMVWEILLIFNRKYLKITAICSAVAIVISYILVNMYFSGFAYHYPINPWIFILGVLIAMAITALVVTAASFKAANENPVNTLANE